MAGDDIGLQSSCFGFALWPITIARRVTCHAYPAFKKHFHVRARLVGPRLLNFAAWCGAFGGAVALHAVFVVLRLFIFVQLYIHVVTLCLILSVVVVIQFH